MFRIGRKVLRRFQCPNSLKSTQEESSGLQAPWPLIGFQDSIGELVWKTSGRLMCIQSHEPWQAGKSPHEVLLIAGKIIKQHEGFSSKHQQAMFDYWRVDKSCFPCSNS